jgi:hypothetical protein
MPDLDFEEVKGSWKGNDYNTVALTRVTMDRRTVALVFMTHMNVDFDGAPTAYGPPSKNPLDSLSNAGRFDGNTGYYGVAAVDPKTRLTNVWSPPKKAPDSVRVDPAFPDKLGRCPVIQVSPDPAPGFYVSTTSRSSGKNSDPFTQLHYLDASAVPFHALSGHLERLGVAHDEFGLALRHDVYKTASFRQLGGEGHANSSALGECSYKVFLDIGGTPKKPSEKYANNNFQTSFILFPGSKQSQLNAISTGANADDLAVFLAFQRKKDSLVLGQSAVPDFKAYVKGGRVTKPDGWGRIAHALQPWGYNVAAINTAQWHGLQRFGSRYIILSNKQADIESQLVRWIQEVLDNSPPPQGIPSITAKELVSKARGLDDVLEAPTSMSIPAPPNSRGRQTVYAQFKRVSLPGGSWYISEVRFTLTPVSSALIF